MSRFLSEDVTGVVQGLKQSGDFLHVEAFVDGLLMRLVLHDVPRVESAVTG